MKPRNHIAKAQQSGAGKHTDRREKVNKKFQVIATHTLHCGAVIEAETQEEAHQIALNMDGGDFTPINGNNGDWWIDRVEECK
jgi:hypothetical protein